MSRKAAITVQLPQDEAQRAWSSFPRPEGVEGNATFKDAPGDRGTEVYLEVEQSGPLGGVVEKVTGATTLAKAKDHLRHFKQKAETGEIPRSDGTPEGESVARKLKQRPAQPLPEDELAKAGAR